MQFYVQEVIVWLILVFPQTTPTYDAEKSLVSHTVLAHSKKDLHNKKRKPSREHWCGASQIHSESQVRIIHNSRVPKLGKLYVPWLLKVLGLL